MLLAALALLSADVLDVGPAPAPFPDIRSAVQAATDGDLIRVQAGTYPFFGVFGKSLKIVAADDAAEVEVRGTVRIQNLGPGQTVVLDGINIEAERQATGAALIVANTAGPVRLHDCVLQGAREFNAEPVTSLRIGLRTVGVSDLTMSSSSIIGGFEWKSNGGVVGQEGAVLEDTVATFWNCSITGSDCSIQAFGFNGGDGVRAYGSEIYVHGGTVNAGNGGDSADWPSCQANGCGGDCLRLAGTSLRYCSVDFNPGTAGWDVYQCGGCTSFASGQDIVLSGGATSEAFPGPPITFDSGHGWMSSGDPVTFDIGGPTGFSTLMILGPETGRLVPTQPGFEGDVHVVGPAGSPRRVFLGASPAALATTLPDFGDFAITEWYLQPVLVGGGRIVMGPLRSLTILGLGL